MRVFNRPTVVIAIVATFGPIGSMACNRQPAPATGAAPVAGAAPEAGSASGAGSAPVAAGEPYIPGFGEIMSLQQMRHTKLWLAGQAGNWPLAEYELEELGEGFDDVVKFYP